MMCLLYTASVYFYFMFPVNSRESLHRSLHRSVGARPHGGTTDGGDAQRTALANHIARVQPAAPHGSMGILW